MSKKITYFVIFFLLSFNAIADEGLWPPYMLNQGVINKLHKAGCKLTADEIFSTQHASLKDAVVIFGGGCTAELISNQGLLLTNYHCGYSSIQRHSSLEHDYLTDGFWAYSKEQELPNPGLTVTFVISMDDVSSRFNNILNDKMTQKRRQEIIDSISKIVVTEKLKELNGQYEAEVKPFYNGNSFVLIVTQTFKDIRLVGAPPSAIGKFGGDTDNWVWPRHTGDFSIFRIYADKNNQPADYSPDNVPYRPKKYLKINTGGIKENDFTMIFGFPGYTQEYLPSYLVNNIINTVNPLRIMIRQKKLDIIDEAMKNNRTIRIQYSAKQARIANAWKKWIGQNQGLKRLEILKLKRQNEQNFQVWAEKYHNGKYTSLLSDYKQIARAIIPYKKAYYSFVEIIYFSDLRTIFQIVDKKLNTNKLSKTQQKKLFKALRGFYKNYNLELDEKIMKNTIEIYFAQNDTDFYPSVYSLIKGKFGGNTGNYITYVYNSSVLTDSNRLFDFIKNYNKNPKQKTKKFKRDPAVKMIKSFYDVFQNSVQPKYIFFSEKLDSLNRLYMKAKMQKDTDSLFYPDANFTLRIGYGHIRGFRPRDGIIYDYYTTLDGVIEKDNPEIYDYNVPEKLKELYVNKDYGNYADQSDGKIHVAFIGDNHTTGGNSGSPVLNANGELIGVNFDRCWESTMSDIKFDPDYCRNIMLDIRYVLFVVDKYANAKNIIKEIEFVHQN